MIWLFNFGGDQIFVDFVRFLIRDSLGSFIYMISRVGRESIQLPYTASKMSLLSISAYISKTLHIK